MAQHKIRQKRPSLALRTDGQPAALITNHQDHWISSILVRWFMLKCDAGSWWLIGVKVCQLWTWTAVGWKLIWCTSAANLMTYTVMKPYELGPDHSWISSIWVLLVFSSCQKSLGLGTDGPYHMYYLNKVIPIWTHMTDMKWFSSSRRGVLNYDGEPILSSPRLFIFSWLPWYHLCCVKFLTKQLSIHTYSDSLLCRKKSRYIIFKKRSEYGGNLCGRTDWTLWVNFLLIHSKILITMIPVLTSNLALELEVETQSQCKRQCQSRCASHSISYWCHLI